jgi:hypothetical protein
VPSLLQAAAMLKVFWTYPLISQSICDNIVILTGA